MDLVEAIVDLQINFHVYNNLYAVDRQGVAEHLKSILWNLKIVNLSDTTITTIIDKVIQHPVNLRMKNPDYTEQSEIGRRMLELRRIVHEQHKHYDILTTKNGKLRKTVLTRRKAKKLSNASNRIHA